MTAKTKKSRPHAKHRVAIKNHFEQHNVSPTDQKTALADMLASLSQGGDGTFPDTDDNFAADDVDAGDQMANDDSDSDVQTA